MSSIEVDTLEVGGDPSPITVEGYEGEYYSSFWPSDKSYILLLEFSDQLSLSSDAMATIKTPSGSRIQVDYEVADKHLSEETDLFRIDDHEYAITWQQLDDGVTRFGFVSYDPNIELLADLYQRSTPNELSRSDYEELEEFLSNY